MDSSYDSDDIPEGVDGLFDQSIFDNLNKELDDLRESFDLIDTAKGSTKDDDDDDDDYDSDSDGDDSGSVEESAPSGINAAAGGGVTKKNNNSNDDDDDGDDYDSDYQDYDEDDPDSGENKLFSMMDDLVMQLQMDLKEGDGNDDHQPSTPDNKTEAAVTTRTPHQLVNSSSGNSATKPRSDSVGTTGSTGSGRKRAATATPEDREKGMRLHMQVRSLLKRVTDMATHATEGDDEDDVEGEEHVGFHQTEKKEGDDGGAVATIGNTETPERRKRGDSSADQIERLLGAIENYSQSHTPSPFRNTATSSQSSTNNSNNSIESPALVNVPVDSVASVESAPTEEEGHAKTARAMSGLLLKKRREYLMRRKHEEESQKKKETNIDGDHQDGNEDKNNIDDTERVAEMRNAAIREAVPVSAEEEQLRKQQQEEKLRQHRRSQEELLRRRVQLMRQQQLLQQKEQLLLQHQYVMQQSQQYQQQQQQALAARQQSVTTTTTTNKNKKKKGKKKRTNKHRKGKRKVKPVGTGGGNYPGGYPMHHPQQNAVSQKTLQALYAKLLALDEQLSAEYGDCAQ